MSGMDGMKLGASGAGREEQIGSETLMARGLDRKQQPLPTWVRVETFPTWGSNPVLHTQGTRGIIAKKCGLSAIYPNPPPLTLSPPGV